MKKRAPASVEIGSESTVRNVGAKVEDVTSIGPHAAVRVAGKTIVNPRVRRVLHIAGRSRSRWIGLGTLASLVGLGIAIWQVAFS